jgi:galacturan 1,4-alpha-galacturonidase
MIYSQGKIKDINIAYIGGGSRGWAWGLMSDLAAEGDISGNIRLYDINHEAALNNEAIGNKLKDREDVVGKWSYTAVGSLEQALTGADFVIISILPGTLKEMYSDVHTPEKYGIYQPVGDTVGPGGLIRALRTLPMYVEIAEAIKAFSPKAWVINYTNPMTLCVRTLYEVFPQIKAFGCCHEVFGTQNLLSNAVKEITGVEGDILRNEIKVNVQGINHFTWINSASYKGYDIFPIYKEFIDKNYENGFGCEDNAWKTNPFTSANRIKFDLFRRYGIIAAAGDRHLAEFCPNSWYLKDKKTVDSWKIALTTVDYRMEDLKKRLDRSERLRSGEEAFELNKTGEEGVLQIKALLGLGDLVTNVNVPNRGQIPNLPIGAVVETNALFGRDSVSPVMAGDVTSEVNGLITKHVMNQETVLKAALNKDKKLAFTAFMNDPLCSTLSLKEGASLYDEMLKNTKEYLPGWRL